MFPEALTVGSWASTTVTLKVQVLVFDEASVKVYVTKVVPIGNNVVPGACDLDE